MSEALLFAVLAFLLAMGQAFFLQACYDAIKSRTPPAVGTSDHSDALPFISVVVPARNAIPSIATVLQDLRAQIYPLDRFEVMVVDDKSTDDTAGIVRSMMRTWSGLQLLSSGTAGKKAAITTGVAAAKGDIVLLTDADVRCGRDRLRDLAHHWMTSRADLVLMPVLTTGGNGPTAWLQREEQLALQAVSAGSALVGRPVLANGANMAFTRQAFMDVGGYQGDRWASGDDMFLLQRMRHARRSVTYLLEPGAVVHVEPEESWSAALSQRLRWAGKMRMYREPVGMIASGMAVLMPWVLLVLTLCSLRAVKDPNELFHPALLLPAAWLVWMIPIVRLVGAMRDFFNGPIDRAMRPAGKASVASTVVALVAFTLYTPLIAILSIFVRPTWKGRRI